MTLKKTLSLLLILVLSLLCIVACVEKTVKSIEIVEGSVSTTVEKGGTIDTSSLKVKVTYSDDSTEEIGVDDVEINQIDTSVVGDHSLEVTYEGLTDDITITVTEPTSSAKTVQSIAYTGDAISLDVGGTLDKSALKVTVTYSDGTTAQVGVADGVAINDSTVNSALGGQYAAVVTYQGKVTTIPVEVVAALEEIVYVTDSFDTNLDHNETVDTSTIKVTAKYNDDTEKEIGANKLTIGAIDTATVGEGKSFTITYEGKSVSVTYNVVKVVTGIEINASSVAESGVVDSTFDVSGLSVKVVYSDGTEDAAVTEGVEVTNIDTSSAGEKTLTAKLGDATDTLTVTVEPKLVSIEFASDSTLPEKVAHNSTENVTAGIKVNANYKYAEDDVRAVDVTADASITNPGTATVGEVTVTVTYQNAEAITDTYEVEKVLESITYNSGNALVVAHNSDFNMEDIKVIATYSAGEPVEISYADLVVTGAVDTSNLEGGSFTIKYETAYATKEITVNYTVEIVITEVIIKGVNTSVNVGETLDVTGLKLDVKYSNGSTVSDVTVDASAITNISTDTAGTAQLKVMYEGKEYTLDIEVVAVIQSIEIKIPEGVALNFAHKSQVDLAALGVKVVAKYNGAADAEIAITTEMVTDLTTEVVTENGTLTVTYQGKTATAEYTVYKTVVSLTLKDGAYQLTYKPGEALPTATTVAAIVTYSDDTYEEVVATLGANALDTTNPGSQATVEITYEEVKGEFNVSVLDVESIVISGVDTELPLTPNGTITDEQVTAGITVTVTLSDETVLTLDTPEELAAVTLTHNVVITAKGEYKLTANYYGNTANVTITVYPVVVSVVFEGTAPEFSAGVTEEQIKAALSTLKVKVTYNDGSEPQEVGVSDGVMIDYSDIDVTAEADASAGKTFTVTFNEGTVEVGYTVSKAIASSNFSFGSTDFALSVGEEFALADDAVFTITYEGEEATDVKDLVSVDLGGYDGSKTGVYTVTVSYRGIVITETLYVSIIIDPDTEVSDNLTPEDPF